MPRDCCPTPACSLQALPEGSRQQTLGEPSVGLSCESQAGVWRWSRLLLSLCGVFLLRPPDRCGVPYVSLRVWMKGGQRVPWQGPGPPKTCYLGCQPALAALSTEKYKTTKGLAQKEEALQSLSCTSPVPPVPPQQKGLK